MSSKILDEGDILGEKDDPIRFAIVEILGSGGFGIVCKTALSAMRTAFQGFLGSTSGKAFITNERTGVWGKAFLPLLLAICTVLLVGCKASGPIGHFDSTSSEPVYSRHAFRISICYMEKRMGPSSV